MRRKKGGREREGARRERYRDGGRVKWGEGTGKGKEGVLLLLFLYHNYSFRYIHTTVLVRAPSLGLQRYLIFLMF